MALRRWIALGMLVAASCHRELPPELPGAVETRLTISADGTLLVPAVLHGRRGAVQHHQLVVDTAASITALTPATAAALGIRGAHAMVINEGRDAIPARQATLPRLSVGGVVFRDLTVAIVDLPDARRIDARFGGILGLDVLAHHDVVIDLVRGRFTLHPAGYAARSDAVRAMQRIPFDRSRYGLIALAVRVEGYPEMLGVLDLGAQGSVVNRAAARMLSDYTSRSVLTLAPRTPRYGRLELAGLALDHRGFQIEDLGVFLRLRADKRPAMLLGADLFRGRSIVLAYQDRAVYVSR